MVCAKTFNSSHIFVTELDPENDTSEAARPIRMDTSKLSKYWILALLLS